MFSPSGHSWDGKIQLQAHQRVESLGSGQDSNLGDDGELDSNRDDIGGQDQSYGGPVPVGVQARDNEGGNQLSAKVETPQNSVQIYDGVSAMAAPGRPRGTTLSGFVQCTRDTNDLHAAVISRDRRINAMVDVPSRVPTRRCWRQRPTSRRTPAAATGKTAQWSGVQKA